MDANGHQTRTLVDGFGRTRYRETFTGNSSGTYALEGATRSDYDWLGDVTAVYEPNTSPPNAAGLSATAQTTAVYDRLGRMTQETDADLGLITYSRDANGNVTRRTDPRGNYVGTVYTSYDGLNRPIWVNNHGSSSNAYVTYTYDQTDSLHGEGAGHLTHETFTNANAPSGSPSMSGSYDYQYDARGRQISVTQGAEGATTYTVAMTYNDANQAATLQYSDDELLSYTYNGFGWLTDVVTQPSGGAATNLLTNITYSGVGGAAGKPTGASMANGTYSFSASYDNDLRLASESLLDGSTTRYALSLGYDGASNVTSAATQLSQGGATQTDNQAFCYNARNQLTWAGAIGTPPCGASLTLGSLSAAEYTQSFSYDALGRLAASTSGGYSYGDSAHIHAATAISSPSAYTAAYDTAGNMICRAPSSAATCAGSDPASWTGQALAYDNAGQLTHWASAPSGSVSTASFLYDGSGQRVEQQSTPANQATTTTHYVLGGLEEDSNGTLTKYFNVPGLPSAVRVGTSGALSYLASDRLGSVSVGLDGSGNVTAAQLYAPYGGLRYSSGTMPTAKGFTGQRADSLSGLDYYGARYYDPVAGQFTSADTVVNGLSPYAYVRGNPETLTDPSGHRYECPNGCGGGGQNPPPTAPGDGNGNGSGDGNQPPATCTPTGGAKACSGPGSGPSGPDNRGFETAKDIASIVFGLTMIGLGVTAIVQLLTNPAAQTLEGVAALFGVNSAAAYIGAIATILNGFSLILHAAGRILTRMGMVDGNLARELTGVEAVVDVAAAIFTGLMVISSVQTMIVAIGKNLPVLTAKVLPYIVGVVNSATTVNNGIQDAENAHDSDSCRSHPEASCQNG